jgi:hypothetical protein
MNPNQPRILSSAAIASIANGLPVPHFTIRAREGSRLKLVAAVLALAVPFLPGDGRGATLEGIAIAEVGLTERICVDRISGVAIGGYDPVAYFTTGRGVPGSTEFEAIWQGAVWRFANEGNRAAFLADPTVYAPQFGGYDAASIATGVATPADPSVFAIQRDRLFLFRDEAARRAFLGSPDTARDAQSAWPRLESRLIR